jgi:hypothetical protein
MYVLKYVVYWFDCRAGCRKQSMFSCWRSRQVGKAGRTLDCMQVTDNDNKALDLDIPIDVSAAVVDCRVVLTEEVDTERNTLPNGT